MEQPEPVKHIRHVMDVENVHFNEDMLVDISKYDDQDVAEWLQSQRGQRFIRRYCNIEGGIETPKEDSTFIDPFIFVKAIMDLDPEMERWVIKGVCRELVRATLKTPVVTDDEDDFVYRELESPVITDDEDFAKWPRSQEVIDEILDDDEKLRIIESLLNSSKKVNNYSTYANAYSGQQNPPLTGIATPHKKRAKNTDNDSILSDILDRLTKIENALNKPHSPLTRVIIQKSDSYSCYEYILTISNQSYAHWDLTNTLRAEVYHYPKESVMDILRNKLSSEPHLRIVGLNDYGDHTIIRFATRGYLSSVMIDSLIFGTVESFIYPSKKN